MDDRPWFLCTITQPGDYDPRTRSWDEELEAGEHRELPDALTEWERLMVDHAWQGACRVWHVDPDYRRQLVACSTIGRDADTGLTAYGRSLMRAIDAPPVAYRVLPDPSAIVAGEHSFVARRLDPAAGHQLLRCALSVANDGSWQCAVQPVTQDGKPAGPALVVNGTEMDPAVTALAVIAGAAPLPERPIGTQPN